MSIAINNKPGIHFRGLFLFFFFVFVATTNLYPGTGSNGNVEQWINITNQYFYGQQDLLFSYGPLYWLVSGVTTQFSATSYWMAVIFISGIFAYFWTTIISIASETSSLPFVALIFLLFLGSLNFSPALFLWPFILVLYLDLHQSKKIDLKACFLLGSLIALAAYLRFFWGVVALATIGSYLFSCALADRKITGLVALLVGLIISYVLIGLIAFHNTTSLVDYLIINNQLSFGNSVDMTLDQSNRAGTWVAVALIAISMNVYLLLRKKQLLITVNVLLLLFLKLGFSRTDHYVTYFVGPVAILVLLPLLDKSLFGRVVWLIGTACLYYLMVVPSFPGGPVKKVLQPAVNFKTDYASRMEAAYKDFKLDRDLLDIIGNNTIDVYPYNNEYMFANKLNYKHRPLFQNYMTLTPKLDAMNQGFFESEDRPQFVLWTAGITCAVSECNPFDSFDNKYSLNEDPLTTSSILLNYHMVKTGTGKSGTPLVLMERNRTTTKYAETRIKTENGMTFGTWYALPKASAGLLKIKPEFMFTLYGRAKNMLFRGDILKVKYKLANGATREYRANILNASSGVIVSPLLENFSLSGPAPTHIMFETSSDRYFKPVFKADWISIPAAELKVSKPHADARSEVAPKHDQVKTINCDGSLDVINSATYANQPLVLSGGLEVQGWLASSVKSGDLYDQTFLVITDGKGKESYVASRVQSREDLVNAFKIENLRTAGFVSSVDVSFVDGPSTIGLAGLKGSTLYKCSQFAAKFSLQQ